MKMRLFLPLFLASCASIVNPGPDQVQVTTEPSGAKVILNEREVGTTPCVVLVSRSTTDTQDLIFEREGYHRQLVRVDRVPNGATFLNMFFLIPGILFSLIDAASGNNIKFPSSPIHVDLIPVSEEHRGIFYPNRYRYDEQSERSTKGIWKMPSDTSR